MHGKLVIRNVMRVIPSRIGIYQNKQQSVAISLATGEKHELEIRVKSERKNGR